jgi:hypothetical protein
MALDTPIPIIDVRAEGYFAITSNSIQFGGRLDISISLGIEAHGFVQADAIVQFRPFHFEARVAAGFDVSVAGFSFASVTLEGSISGPGPIVIRGSLSIDVFSISWDETFTLGSGPSDTLPSPVSLLDVLAAEFAKPESVHATSIGDPNVVLAPRPGRAAVAAVPPTGTLQVAQRRAPLGTLIERVDGLPLGGPQGAVLNVTGADVDERFSPGSYVDLTDAEALSRPPFDLLPAGKVLLLADPAPADFGGVDDKRHLRQIVIRNRIRHDETSGLLFDVSHLSALVDAAGKPPALSDTTPLVTVLSETWTTTDGAATFTSATAAHQFARYAATQAVCATDAANPVDLVAI